jgi:hypothetical protein
MFDPFVLSRSGPTLDKLTFKGDYKAIIQPKKIKAAIIFICYIA